MNSTKLAYEALAGDGSDLPSPIRYLPHELDGIRMQKERLAKLDAQRPAWISPPVNDNQNWPLAQQLRKEGNDVLLRVAERYRAIYDAATANVQLVGTSLAGDDLYNLAERSYAQEDGTVVSLGVRKARPKKDELKASKDDPEEEAGANEKKKPITFKPRNPSPTRNAWNGDAMINAAIDSRRMLLDLQKALGPLLEVFEDAVLHGETLSSIGEGQGAHSKTAGAVGKWMVMMGLQAVREELARMDATPE